jgi:hypothetical protein
MMSLRRYGYWSARTSARYNPRCARRAWWTGDPARRTQALAIAGVRTAAVGSTNEIRRMVDPLVRGFNSWQTERPNSLELSMPSARHIEPASGWRCH